MQTAENLAFALFLHGTAPPHANRFSEEQRQNIARDLLRTSHVREIVLILRERIAERGIDEIALTPMTDYEFDTLLEVVNHTKEL